MLINLLQGYDLPSLYPVLGPLLDWLVKGVGSIGWGVVLFTIIIKTVLLPLDYWQRAGMKKNSLKMEKMRPQLEKLQKQYANDQALYNQKLQSLYKKEGYSMMGSCLPMIVTLVVFYFVFAAFRGYLQYYLVSGYNTLLEAYASVGENADEWAKIALQYQDQIAPSFLWIKNVWVADVPWKKALMTASEFFTQAGLPTANPGIEYDPIMAPFADTLQKANGWLVLPLLSAGTSLLLQVISNKANKAQMDLQAGNAAATNKMMMWMMPIMMAIFSISWTAIFAIYLVTSSLYSILTTVVINKVVDLRFKKQEEEERLKNARR